jgi:hypothetical protein
VTGEWQGVVLTAPGIETLGKTAPGTSSSFGTQLGELAKNAGNEAVMAKGYTS